MASKKRINKEKLFLLTTGSVCLAFMAFTTMMFPAVKLSYSSYHTEVSGLHAVFGGSVTNVQLAPNNYNFNIVVLIGYLLPLVSLVLSILAFKKEGIALNYIAAILCLVATIVMFLEPTLFTLFNEVNSNYNVSILFGPVVGGVLALISGLFNLGCVKLKS